MHNVVMTLVSHMNLAVKNNREVYPCMEKETFPGNKHSSLNCIL